MQLPKQTDKIFSILQSGKFICTSSTDSETRSFYSIIEENYEELSEYFSHINLFLESGEGFYYFSKKDLKADLERKIISAYRWIDILDFFTTYDNGFGVSSKFAIADVESNIKVDPLLKTKIGSIKGDGNHRDKIEKMVKELKNFGIVELEDDITNTYKVLDSYSYLQQLIMKIHLPDIEMEG